MFDTDRSIEREEDPVATVWTDMKWRDRVYEYPIT